MVGSPYSVHLHRRRRSQLLVHVYVAGLSVSVAPLTLTVDGRQRRMTYGSTPPAITPSYAGFVNGDSASSLTTKPTCSTTATSASLSSGSPYTSSCNGAVDANYAITYVAGTVTVTQAPLTVTASSGAMNYGGTPPPSLRPTAASSTGSRPRRSPRHRAARRRPPARARLGLLVDLLRRGGPQLHHHATRPAR